MASSIICDSVQWASRDLIGCSEHTANIRMTDMALMPTPRVTKFKLRLPMQPDFDLIRRHAALHTSKSEWLLIDAEYFARQSIATMSIRTAIARPSGFLPVVMSAD